MTDRLYQPGDLVQIIAEGPTPGMPIRDHLGQEARIVHVGEGDLYEIEIDLPPRAPTLGQPAAPRFLVAGYMIAPDVSPAMLKAAVEVSCVDNQALYIAIYRAMRAARFKR